MSHLNATRLVGALVAASLGAACGGNSGPSAAFLAGEEARRLVLTDITDNVVLPAHAAFVTRAEALEAAAGLYATNPADSSNTTNVRSAWTAAMDAWQEVEVLQFGPAGSATETVGGMGLKDRVYAWPLINPCRIDQETLAESYSDPAAIASAAANIRGLDAMEYLLFNTSSENACPINAEINTSGSWAAAGTETIATRRAAHAHALAVDVVASAKALRDAWLGDSGFRLELVEAGKRSAYVSAQEALNNVSNALFYLDTEVKDLKLGVPLGYANCATATCPESFEGRLSFRAKANIEANVRAFRRVFAGADTTALARATPRHFYALLVAAGAVELADQTLDALDRTEAALADITTDLESALFNDLESVEAIYAAVKSVTDLMKTEFVSALDLEIPQRAEGDND